MFIKNKKKIKKNTVIKMVCFKCDTTYIVKM